MQSIQAANSILPEHVVIRSDGKIEVQSVQALPKFKTYKVSFGDENKMPSCECDNWQLNLLPCKHFFAVMLHSPQYSWHSLPAMYRDSPFFCLDDLHVVPKDSSQSEPMIQTEVHEDDALSLGEEEQTARKAVQLPKRSSTRLTVARECRDYLSQIRNLTYLITDETTLQHLFLKLHQISEDLQNIADRDNGFILEDTGHINQGLQQKIKRKRAATEDPLITSEGAQSRSSHETTGQVRLLPKKQNDKSSKRRYGQAYDTRVAHTNVNLDIATGLPGTVQWIFTAEQYCLDAYMYPGTTQTLGQQGLKLPTPTFFKDMG